MLFQETKIILYKQFKKRKKLFLEVNNLLKSEPLW